MPYDRKTCPVCGGDTWQLRGEKDDYPADWKKDAEKLAKRWRPGQPLPDGTVQLFRYKGVLFVRTDELENAGYMDVTTGSILKLHGQFFEVNGQFNKEDADGWWVEQVKELEVNHPVLTEAQYKALDKQRGLRT